MIQPAARASVQAAPIQPGRISQSLQNPPPVSQYQSSGRANFGETTILGGGSGIGTTILTSGPGAPQGTMTAYLIRTLTGERVDIRGEVLRIGKESSYADYCISDNPAVSRSHATIRRQEGSYFIVDMNSRNHTFVDNQMLPSNIETKLEHGMKIRLGNEELVFYQY
jgi:pSer/pThr/pTyr-binding forkhead associated (FHA) protein